MRLELAAAPAAPYSVLRIPCTPHPDIFSLLSLASVPEPGLICLVIRTVSDTQLNQHEAPPRLKRSLENEGEESRSPESSSSSTSWLTSATGALHGRVAKAVSGSRKGWERMTKRDIAMVHNGGRWEEAPGLWRGTRLISQVTLNLVPMRFSPSLFVCSNGGCGW